MLKSKKYKFDGEQTSRIILDSFSNPESGIEKSEKMSLTLTSSSAWPGQYRGTTGWSEKTRQAQIGDHGPLFDRVLSFNEIPNLKFSIKLSFPEDYETAKRRPVFECKLIEGGEMLNDHNNIYIEISYSTEGATCCCKTG